jgi:hypothetical protein
LLIEIVAGETIDEDEPGVVLTKGYTLSAPAGYTFVSPLSSLVQNEIDNGSSVTEAEVSVQGKLGTTLSLNEDYVAGKTGEDNADEFEKLHQIAQVTANVITNNIALLEDSAKTANIDLDDLISLIINEVFDAIDEIILQVEVAAADDSVTFDPDTIATTIDDEFIELEQDTLEEQIAQNEAEQQASVASLVSLVQGDGINWFWAEMEDNGPEFDYGTLKLDSQGNVDDKEYSWESDQWVLQTPSDNNEEWLLISTGWVAYNETVETVTLNADATITIQHAGLPVLDETISAVELPLAGLNVSLITDDTDGDGTLADALPDDIVFPEGAVGYKLTFTLANDFYTFNDWGGCELINELGGLCNTVWLQNGTGNDDSPAVTLAETVVSSAITLANDSSDTANLKGLHLGWDGGITLVAEFVANGTINYYNENFSAQTVVKIATGTWTDVQVHGQTLRKVTAPNYFSEYDGFFDDRNNIVLFEYLDGVRLGELEDGEDDDQETVFNTIAKDFILANFDPSLIPAQ